MAHELGHTMHSYFSNQTQPYPTPSYPIFVAEVASTFNEALLIDHMLKTIKDDATKLSLLGNYLEGIKSTVFRQTQFAEFELRVHEMAEKGQPVTGEELDRLYAVDHQEVLRPRPEGLHRRRVHRARMGVHPALLPQLLRVPVRDVVHAAEALAEKVMAGDQAAIQALPDVPRLRADPGTRSICSRTLAST